MAEIEVGDIITVGSDPQRWRAVAEGSAEGIIKAWKLVPIDENNQEISLEEYRRNYDIRTGRKPASGL